MQVPGQGLYLDELFFDKYNLKLQYESDKRQKGKNREHSKASSNTVTLAIEQCESGEATEVMESGDVEGASCTSAAGGDECVGMATVNTGEYTAAAAGDDQEEDTNTFSVSFVKKCV